MLEFQIPWEIFPFFFFVAFLYSSVGHGGASGYLALFALFGIASPAIAPIVLALNIIVASTSCYNYYRSGFFSARLLLPFVISSIPAAFLGGFVPISQTLFSFILGVALLLAAARILFPGKTEAGTVKLDNQQLWKLGIPIGAVLGCVSGMIGIGGGVFLSPLLLILGWADMKRTAATSSAFIVLNSISGLAGHAARGNVDVDNLLPLAFAVACGGFLGSRLGAFQFPVRLLQGLLALVLLMAGTKLVWKILL